MASWFGSIISSLTGTATPVPNFNFTFKHTEYDGDAVSWTSACGTTWTIKNGKKVNAGGASGSSTDLTSPGLGGGGADDSTSSDDVSIFVCEIAKQTEEGLVRNVLKRAKGLMLPGVLRCFGAVEHNGQIFVAVERCVPLKTILAQRSVNKFYKIGTTEENEDDEEDRLSTGAAIQKTTTEEKFHVAVACGMNSISSALAALHRNNLLHGAVNIDSVFVTDDSGEWRLFGYDYVATFDEIIGGNTSFNRSASRVLAPHRLAPELSASSAAASSQLTSATVAQIDSWGLGILLFETFYNYNPNNNSNASSNRPSLPTSSTSNDLRTPKIIPRDFLSSYNVLVTANAKLRWTADRFHREAEMLHGGFKIVRLITDLEQLTLKDTADRDAFYRELGTCVDSCPSKLATGLILPKISSLLQYGGCSAAALVPLLRIARKLSTEAFAVRVAPSVLVMFSSNEPLIRMKLLENAELYAPLLPEKLVCDKIWPLYLGGLTSKIPEIRELSIRALVHFAPVLTERFASGDVVKALLALQQDAQGAIRTNTTICLGMLARFLPSESRAKTLCSGFGRMLKDPYAPSRAAAVKSIASLADETFTAQMICEQLLPALCPLLLDTDRITRDAATNAVQTLVKQGVSMAESSVPCVATQPAMNNQQQQQNTSTSSSSSSLSVTSSSVKPLTATPKQPTAASSNNFVSTPTAVKPQISSSNNASLDITPMKNSTSSNSFNNTNNNKPATTSKGWDNDFSDDDDDAVFNTTTTTTSTAVAKKVATPIASSTTNSSNVQQQQQPVVNVVPITVIAKPKKEEPAFTDILENSTSAAGGGMKLGATTVKKRGFGVKN